MQFPSVCVASVNGEREREVRRCGHNLLQTSFHERYGKVYASLPSNPHSTTLRLINLKALNQSV